jgi:hypothetical protein
MASPIVGGIPEYTAQYGCYAFGALLKLLYEKGLLPRELARDAFVCISLEYGNDEAACGAVDIQLDKIVGHLGTISTREGAG